MKSLMTLWQSVADDLAAQCCTSAARDFETVSRRVKDEGESFFTITLPSFGKDLEKALDRGFFGDDLCTGFRRMRGGLPAFLQGFLLQIFDPKSGCALRSDACADSIRAVRQLTLMFGKVERPCSDARNLAALHAYIACEQEVKMNDSRITAFGYDLLCQSWSLLFGDILSRWESELFANSFSGWVPKHGPGATADKLVGNQKYNQSEWPERLDRVFPFGEFCVPSWAWFNPDAVDFLEPGRERPVKVTLVPKTAKTPRIIAIEPTAMQYAQQAVWKRFLADWERDDILSQLLGFDDQIPNQEMARLGSVDGSLATIDLSEASDRVSNELVRTVMQRTPYVQELFDAVRSRRASVPLPSGDKVIRLAKYASMGSAVCFPLEAMVFLTIVVFSIGRQLGVRPNRQLLSGLVGRVRIFGDDIVVPEEFVLGVVDDLHSFGGKVNVDKSFWTGRFRESCGKEYFRGVDVSIVRFRRDFPTSRQDAEELVSLVSFRNQVYNLGLWGTCQRLDEVIRSFGPFPITESSSSLLGRESCCFEPEAENSCADLHVPLVKGMAVKALIPKNEIDGVGALTKALVTGFNEDPDHLLRSGRPRDVSIISRLATPY